MAVKKTILINPAKAEALTAIGVDHVLLDTGEIAKQVRELIDGGVDTALELIGTPTLVDTLRTKHFTASTASLTCCRISGRSKTSIPSAISRAGSGSPPTVATRPTCLRKSCRASWTPSPRV
ncbi:hypothetical protein [Nocardia sp. NPDC057440]|uniref:hypothetical protein n=1 Tax=Nocardia sp. NPDC057440 TaxID=3346134 RepID=UPI00366DC7CB